MALRDFLEQLHVREKITTSQEYLFDVINLMPEGVIVTDARGYVIFCNKQAPKLLHRSEKKILHAHLTDVFKRSFMIKNKTFSANTTPTIPFPVFFQQRILHKKKAITGQDIIYEHRGQQYILSANVRPVFDDGDTIETVIVSLRDVTKRRKNQENQVQFARVMGHELKHPLASMKAYMHFIRKLSDPANSKIKTYLQKTDHQVNMLVKMINDLLDISKISANRLAVDLHPKDIVSIVKDTVSDVKPVHATHTLKFTGKGTLKAAVDELRLRQVITNLISNAVKYSPEGSSVHINVSKVGNKALIKVRDHGPGIDEAKIDQIFEPYSRLETDKKVKGLGLGLYISKNIIDKHNGRIMVQNHTNGGAVFILELPLFHK